MIPEMKFHVYNQDGAPLMWDTNLIEFDTEKDAKDFVESIPEINLADCVIKPTIAFLDDEASGRINFSHCIMNDDKLIDKFTKKEIDPYEERLFCERGTE